MYRFVRICTNLVKIAYLSYFLVHYVHKVNMVNVVNDTNKYSVLQLLVESKINKRPKKH